MPRWIYYAYLVTEFATYASTVAAVLAVCINS